MAVIIKIFGLFYKIISTRLLGIEGMKMLSIIFPSVGLFLSLSSFSIQIVSNQMIALNKKTKELRASSIILSAIRITIITTSIASIILLLLLPIYKNIFNTSLIYLPLLLTIPLLYFSNLSGVFKGYLEGTNNFTHPYISNVIESLTKLILMTIFLLIFKNSDIISKIIIIFLVYLLSEASSFIYLLIIMKRKKGTIIPKKTKGLEIKIFKQALPLTLTILVSSLSNYIFPFYLIILSNKLNIDSEILITEYTLITSYAMPSLVLLESVSTTITKLIFPKITEYRENETKLKRIITNSFIIILLSAILSFSINYFYTDFILYFLYDNNLANIITKKLAFLFILLYFNPLLISILEANNKEKYIFFIQILSDILTIILSTILMIIIGIEGLLYGILIGLLFKFLSLLFIVIKKTKVKINRISLINNILLGILYILSIKIFNNLIISILIYLGLVSLLYLYDNNIKVPYLYKKHKEYL